MDIVLHPILLAFVIVALLLFALSLFMGKYGFISGGAGIILVVLYAINAFLLGFHYLEIAMTILIVAVLFLAVLLMKERKR